MIRWKAQSLSILEGFLNLSEIVLIRNNVNHPFYNAAFLHGTFQSAPRSVFHKIKNGAKLR